MTLTGLAVVNAAVSRQSISIARAQTQEELEGTLDFTKTAEEQIDYFEGMLERNGDMSFERQTSILLWLIDLYRSLERYQDVERCYRQILVFYPDDTGVMNSYALFLIETGGKEERAESLLVTATKWARFEDTRSLDQGTTYELLARLKMESGDYDTAVENAKTAIALMDDEASAGARRVLAESLRRAGRYDAAAQAYIDLIALERGTVHEDINALQLFIDRTDSYRGEHLSATLDSAIAARAVEKRRQAEAEGAELVTVRARDGLELEGTLRRRDGDGAVLFVPDLGKSRRVFTPYAQLLGVDGISSLTLDLRGQGGSRYDSLLTQENLPLRHAQELPEDVVAGFRFLQRALKPPPAQIVIVTEGFASAVVERALPRGGLAAPVVHLSPAFDPLDKELANSIAFHPDFPVLVYYSTEDLHALRSASYFRNVKNFSGLQIRPLEKSGRGVEMLKRNPNALEGFQDWVRSVTASP
ncbi:MAG: hypothetical protein PVF33_08145 [Candidatus Latescibacterota bacterium]|jgi:hypothetical protein